MNWRLGVATVPLVAAIVLAVSVRRPVMAGNLYPLLKAVPYEGHSGDLIDISGSGLRPNKTLSITMACPSWLGGAILNGNLHQFADGPQADMNGNFAGYLIRAIPLHHVPSSVCQIYASLGPNPYAGIPAIYTIQRRSMPIPAKVREMRPKVQAVPSRVKTGLSEWIGIRGGWPGARADVSVWYGSTSVRKSTKLDWQGNGHTRVPVVARHFQVGRANVHVHVYLEGMADSRINSQFVVIR